ncbi:hypothetical protein [Kineococcus arenarius]|uniref:hypothetical protein n=1 Tax=Kineococcus sp. SYSU DK007 TaxID=3383128 RepID=UPI003D7D4D4A
MTTAISGPGSRGPRQTLVIDLDAEGVDPEIVVDRAAPPNVVRGVLEAVDVLDGHTRLLSKARIVRAADVDELLAEITDPERTVAVAVAGSFEGAPVDRWADAVNSLLRNGLGVVVGAVLTPDAQEELVQRLPESHTVPAHTIRTFAPQVNLDEVADGARHRVLGARTLERHIHRRGRGIIVDQGLQKLHARSSRQRFLARPLPADVARTMRLLDLASGSEVASVPTVVVEPVPSRPVEGATTSTPWDGTERRNEPLGTSRVSDDVLLGVRGLLHDLGGETLDLVGIADARREVKRLRDDSVGLEKFLDEAEALEAELNETKAFLGLQEQETAKEATELFSVAA